MEETDEALMHAYKRGDQRAFRSLFERHSPTLRRVFSSRLLYQSEVEDLVQQTFLHLHRSRQDFKDGARVRPWLFTIGLNLKREFLRRVKRRPEAPLPDGELGSASEPHVERRAVWAALDQLTPEQREVIVMHWMVGMSFPEIAEALGASVSAVKVRAHRGYESMRRFLE